MSFSQQALPFSTEIESSSKTEPRFQKPLPVFRIKPSPGRAPLRLKELWDYRELLYFLVWRDIKLRYKQTELGIAWAILQPFLAMMIFSLFFGRLAKIPSDGIPYPLFVYTALLPWIFFANGLTQSSNSLVGHSNLITKVYFPRLIIPISAVLTGIFDFVLGFLVLIGMLYYYGMSINAALLYIPLFLLLALLVALAIGLWLSALNVKYRDVRYLMPFIIQIWMFATPIAYSSTLVPERWRVLYGLNPMVGVIEGFRWMLLRTQTQPSPMIAVSAFVALVALAGGMLYFRQVEKAFADVV